MKRVPAREALLLTAPIALIFFGIAGTKLRERFWPSQPRLECQLRRLTPLEAAQGANIAVTARAIVPNGQKGFPYLFVGPLGDNDSGTRKHRAQEVWLQSKREESGKYDYEIEHRAYNWPHVPASSSIDLKLAFLNSPTPPITERLKLDTHDIAQPDLLELRRSNFRVSRITLTSLRGNSEYDLNFHVEDVVDEGQGIDVKHQCVGKWIWNDGKKRVIPTYTNSCFLKNGLTTGFPVQIKLAGIRMPAPKGTTLSGQISVEGGWPQIVTIYWPDSFYSPDLNPELKFTTKLAPLPTQ